MHAAAYIIPDIFVWQKHPHVRLALRCGDCGGNGMLSRKKATCYEQIGPCKSCSGCGWFGISPYEPTSVLQGPLKVPVLQARYNSGIDLWNKKDFSDTYQEGFYEQ